MTFDEDQPLPRPPTSSEDFADNLAIYWFDPTGVGGVIGMGQWPNRGEAITYIAAADVPRRRGFQQTRAPFSLEVDGRSPDRLAAGGVEFVRIGDGCHRIRASHGDEVAIDLTLTDYYPMTPFPNPELMAILETVAPDHLESSGTAVGTIVLDGQTTTVQGWFHRDRSWGDRRADVPVSDYHWSVGTVGPELSWSELICTIPGAGTFRSAYVFLDGRAHACTATRTHTVLDEDLLTVRGWTTWLTTESGRDVTVHASGSGAHFLDQRVRPDVIATDTLSDCSVTIDGERRSGFAALNQIVNPRLGRSAPQRYLGGAITDGLFEIPPSVEPRR